MAQNFHSNFQQQNIRQPSTLSNHDQTLHYGEARMDQLLRENGKKINKKLNQK